MEIVENGKRIKVCPKCRSKKIAEFGNVDRRPGYINYFIRCMDCYCEFDGEWIKIEDYNPKNASDRSKTSD